jgi:hypothetical protein
MARKADPLKDKVVGELATLISRGAPQSQIDDIKDRTLEKVSSGTWKRWFKEAQAQGKDLFVIAQIEGETIRAARAKLDKNEKLTASKMRLELSPSDYLDPMHPSELIDPDTGAISYQKMVGSTLSDIIHLRNAALMPIKGVVAIKDSEIFVQSIFLRLKLMNVSTELLKEAAKHSDLESFVASVLDTIQKKDPIVAKHLRGELRKRLAQHGMDFLNA